MATADEFRRIALSLEGAEEGAHQKHPDFRFGGQVFATLGFPDAGHGMVKLEPMMQEMVIEAEPDVFRPAPGAWGRQGSTLVNLEAADGPLLRSVLTAAWKRVGGA
jgi:hypothetical protein